MDAGKSEFPALTGLLGVFGPGNKTFFQQLKPFQSTKDLIMSLSIQIGVIYKASTSFQRVPSKVTPCPLERYLAFGGFCG